MHKIIDFHTHTFPDYVAAKAINKLSISANLKNHLDGREEDLIKGNKEALIGTSIVLPVATRPGQANDINAGSVKKNKLYNGEGLLYFAAIHPDDINPLIMLSNIKAAGFLGIKLHPVFQNAYIDEDSYLSIIDAASEIGLITVIHAGYDISYPGVDYVCVKYILNMIEQVHPKNLVLAHMGGWNEWDDVERYLCGADVYFDTSFCLTKNEPLDDGKNSMCDVILSNEQFTRIVKKHGADKILFGSDSPWTSLEESVRAVKRSGLSNEDIDKILFLNAKKLLK